MFLAQAIADSDTNIESRINIKMTNQFNIKQLI